MRPFLWIVFSFVGSVWAHDESAGVFPEMVVAKQGAEVALRFDGLTSHEALEVSFVVHFVGPWDGTGFEKWGPDRFQCLVDGEMKLLDATFNNCHLIWSDNIWQSFPDPFHGDQNDAKPRGMHLHHGGTGAEAVASLGFAWGKKDSVDSSYRFRFLISHTSEDAELSFRTDWVEGDNPTTYWIDDLVVKPLVELPELSGKDEEVAWLSLFSGDAGSAQRAWAEVFAAQPDLLVKRAARMVEGDDARVNSIVKALQKGMTPTESLVREVAISPSDKDAEAKYRRVLLLRELALTENLWSSPLKEWWDKEEDSFGVRSVRKAMGADEDANLPLAKARMRIVSYLRMIGSEEALAVAQELDPIDEDALGVSEE